HRLLLSLAGANASDADSFRGLAPVAGLLKEDRLVNDRPRGTFARAEGAQELRMRRLWLAVPLLVFALITLTVGLVARRTVREPYSTPFFHLFFRDTLEMKAWLVTAALMLGGGQLLTPPGSMSCYAFRPRDASIRSSIDGLDGPRSCLRFRSPTTVSFCWDSAPTARVS